MRTIVLLVSACCLISAAGRGADYRFISDYCDAPGVSMVPDCDLDGGGSKTCQVVCEMKEVKSTVWTVECEEFCAPLPGCGIGCSDHSSCNTGCDDESCLAAQKSVACPTCGPLRTRKKLVPKEVSTKVPVYRCVVKDCGRCSDDGSDKQSTPAAPSQTPPQRKDGAAPTSPPRTSAGSGFVANTLRSCRLP